MCHFRNAPFTATTFISCQMEKEGRVATAFGLVFQLSYAFTNRLALAADEMALIVKYQI